MHSFSIKSMEVDNAPVVMAKKLKSLELKPSGQEGLNVGVRTDGKAYSVREHRHAWLYPLDFKKLLGSFKSKRAILTAEVLIQTGARINEARHIKKDDCDFDRNNITLRVTKAKAKLGEKKGKPRTIPINSKFMKRLKAHFKKLESGATLGILSTPAFNLALKKHLKSIGLKNYYMFSTHNIRKTHGNYLKIFGNLGLMKVDATEICLRMGHDYDTFLKHYGSSGVMNNQDVSIGQEILGDLYTRR